MTFSAQLREETEPSYAFDNNQGRASVKDVEIEMMRISASNRKSKTCSNKKRSSKSKIAPYDF